MELVVLPEDVLEPPFYLGIVRRLAVEDIAPVPAEFLDRIRAFGEDTALLVQDRFQHVRHSKPEPP